jgi:cytochrome c peroxidase
MLSSGLVLAAPLAAANPCSPSSSRLRTPMQLAQNPCAAKRNPCAAKANPCAARNPCAAGVDRKLVTRPKGTKPYSAPRAQLVSAGKQLWSDTKLSTNGMSCNTCHQGNAAFGPTFAKPYPHQVAMAEQQSKLKRITLEQMVQFCMIVPMAARPLAWDSKALAALTAYSGVVQKDFIKTQAKNPCAATRK